MRRNLKKSRHFCDALMLIELCDLLLDSRCDASRLQSTYTGHNGQEFQGLRALARRTRY